MPVVAVAAPVRCRALCNAIRSVQGDPRQYKHLHSSEYTSTSADVGLVRESEIARDISFVNCHAPAEAGGAFGKKGGETRKNRAGCRCGPFSRTEHNVAVGEWSAAARLFRCSPPFWSNAPATAAKWQLTKLRSQIIARGQRLPT